MTRLFARIMIIVALFAISFSTWQLFRGNLEAAFSTMPFLLIMYLFIKRQQR